LYIILGDIGGVFKMAFRKVFRRKAPINQTS